MVLGYGVVRTLLPLVRTLGRLGHSRGFAATLNAGRRPFHRINYLGPCIAARLLPARAITALFDRTIGSLRRRLAVETERNLTLSMHMPTGWDPYFAPTMSVLDVYRFGTQHFDHHRRQLTLAEPTSPAMNADLARPQAFRLAGHLVGLWPKVWSARPASADITPSYSMRSTSA